MVKLQLEEFPYKSTVESTTFCWVPIPNSVSDGKILCEKNGLESQLSLKLSIVS